MSPGSLAAMSQGSSASQAAALAAMSQGPSASQAAALAAMSQGSSASQAAALAAMSQGPSASQAAALAAMTQGLTSSSSAQAQAQAAAAISALGGGAPGLGGHQVPTGALEPFFSPRLEINHHRFIPLFSGLCSTVRLRSVLCRGDVLRGPVRGPDGRLPRGDAAGLPHLAATD